VDVYCPQKFDRYSKNAPTEDGSKILTNQKNKMTASQFNIQKEIHSNQVNKILQSVKLNNFHKDAKTQVVELGTQVIETINAMRNEISEQLDGPGHKVDSYDHKENHNEKKAVILNEKQPIYKMRIGIIGELNEIIDKTEKTNNDIITGLEFKRFDKTNAFKENEKLVVDLLKDMKAAVLIDDEEETKPSEEALAVNAVDPPIVGKTEEEFQKEFEEELAKEKASNEETFLGKVFGKKKK
jgi:hypothetical protein